MPPKRQKTGFVLEVLAWVALLGSIYGVLRVGKRAGSPPLERARFVLGAPFVGVALTVQARMVRLATQQPDLTPRLVVASLAGAAALLALHAVERRRADSDL